MARVNWEDDDEIDPRFDSLAGKLGDRDKARGRLIRFWRLAQKYWGERERPPIPREEFDAIDDFAPLVATRYARVTESGVYAGNDAECLARFKWYWDCCERSRVIKERRLAAKVEREKQSPPGLQVDSRWTPGGLQVDSSGSPSGDPPTPTPTPTPTLSSSNSSRNPQAESQPSVDNSRHRPNFEERHLEVATWLFDFIERNNLAADLSKTDLDDWANEIRLAETTDGIALNDLIAVASWALEDSFWRTATQSPSGIRRNWATLVGKFLEHRDVLGNH